MKLSDLKARIVYASQFLSIMAVVTAITSFLFLQVYSTKIFQGEFSERWWLVVLLGSFTASGILGGVAAEILTRHLFYDIRHLERPPGFGLRYFAEFLCSCRTYEVVFEPPLRDMYDEYCDALREGRCWKAQWVRVRGYWSFWAAFLAQTPIFLVKKVYQIWRAIP